MAIRMFPTRDHPRSRGEHGCLPPVELWQMGSSPLARGAHLFIQAQRQERGIIPARAGSTRCGVFSLV